METHCSDFDNLITIGQTIAEVITDMKVRDEIPMTRQQAAIYLGVSESTVNNYVKSGKLTKKVKNGLIGYMPSDLRPLRK